MYATVLSVAEIQNGPSSHILGESMNRVVLNSQKNKTKPNSFHLSYPTMQCNPPSCPRSGYIVPFFLP